MAKAKLKEPTSEPVPAAMIIDRETGEVHLPEPQLVHLVMKAWELHKTIAEHEALLGPLKVELGQKLPSGHSLVVKGVCRVVVSEIERVSIGDPEMLVSVLGDRFTDLVKTEKTYKPSPRLVEMACDGDEPLAPSIRACLRLGKSSSVKLLAEK